MRISDWSSDVCSSDLLRRPVKARLRGPNLCVTHRSPSAGDPRTTGGILAFSSGSSRVALNGRRREIGRASCRERVCQYVEISVVAVSLEQKTAPDDECMTMGVVV